MVRDAVGSRSVPAGAAFLLPSGRSCVLVRLQLQRVIGDLDIMVACLVCGFAGCAIPQKHFRMLVVAMIAPEFIDVLQTELPGPA